MQTPPQSLIPQRRDWQFNALFVAAIVLLSNVVVTLVELLIVGQIGAHTLPIASVSGLTIATLVVCGTRWLRARDEIKHKASLQVGIEQAQRKLALAVDTAKIGNYSPQFQVPHHDSAETRLRRCALECGYK